MEVADSFIRHKIFLEHIGHLLNFHRKRDVHWQVYAENQSQTLRFFLSLIPVGQSASWGIIESRHFPPTTPTTGGAP